MTPEEAQELTARVTAVELQVSKSTATLARVENNTQEIIDFFRGAKVAGRIIIGFGKVAKWISAIGGMVAVIWALIYAYKHGTPPANPL